MNSEAPTWLKIVAAVAVVWNLLGIYAFYADSTLSEAAIAALPEADRLIHAQTPGWLAAVYGIAVIAGFAGSVLLFLHRSPAVVLLALSAAAVVVQFGYLFAFTEILALKGTASAAMPGTITVIAAALLWLSISAKSRGWLR